MEGCDDLKINNKGVALSWVIILFTVLFILGVAITNYSLSEIRLSSRNENSVIAYHLAKSGVEIVYDELYTAIDGMPEEYVDSAALINHLSTMNLINTLGTINSIGDYTVNVSVMEFVGDEDSLKISSTGTVNGVNNTTALIVQYSGPYANPKGWINNGEIAMSGYFQMTHQPVVFRIGKTLGHAVKKAAVNETTTFKAPSLHFRDVSDDNISLEVQDLGPKSFNLESNFITFKGKILITGEEDGNLTLTVFRDDLNNQLGMRYDNGDLINLGFGIVYFGDGIIKQEKVGPNTIETEIKGTGFYYFPNTKDLNLDLESDIAELVPITDPTLVSYLLNRMAQEVKLSLNAERAYWSEE